MNELQLSVQVKHQRSIQFIKQNQYTEFSSKRNSFEFHSLEHTKVQQYYIICITRFHISLKLYIIKCVVIEGTPILYVQFLFAHRNRKCERIRIRTWCVLSMYLLQGPHYLLNGFISVQCIVLLFIQRVHSSYICTFIAVKFIFQLYTPRTTKTRFYVYMACNYVYNVIVLVVIFYVMNQQQYLHKNHWRNKISYNECNVIALHEHSHS